MEEGPDQQEDSASSAGASKARGFDINELEFNLDDAEFDLPTVDKPQTLESILNEIDDDVLDDDDDVPLASGTMHMLKADSGESSSLSSVESMEIRRRERMRAPKTIHGSVLKPSKLKSVSAQVLSAADRVDAGTPTAIAVSSLIAIGTSHGLVLVFDAKQVLKWCLGSTAVGAQYGAVSALSFNRDCSRLLCGFAKGQITMWDLNSGKLLRTITDAHPPGTAVLHVKFTDSFVLAACSDSGGSVFELEFKRLIGVRSCESQCLFSGSRGEVCIIEPLHMNYTIKDHPMQDVMLLAMASLSKVLLVTLRPQLKVMFTHPLKGDPATLPMLAWQFVVIQVSEKDRVIDPVLAFGRDQTVYFYQVICTGPADIRVSGLQKIQLGYKLLSIAAANKSYSGTPILSKCLQLSRGHVFMATIIHAKPLSFINVWWMNPRTLVTLDKSEKLHIIDVRSEEELEVIDVSEAQLVYSTSIFKSLATGGNVSQALACAGEQACYQSVVSHTGQLFLLGTKAVYIYTLRSWKERIDVLVKANQYQDALSLALSFHDGKAKAVIGLPASHSKRMQAVSQLMMDILFDFVDLSMTKLCPDKGKIEELEDYYQEIVPVCVDYCLHLKKTDVLFGRIYERFSVDVIARGTFLECLEPYVQCDRLTAIPPAVMKDFVDHYESRGMLDSVESCIVHLDIASLDIHQVVHLCWSHSLYDAIIYVYTRGMHDYTTPLHQLLSQLGQAVSRGKQLTDTQIRLGNKLLVYISCCLAGRAYPMGDIPDDQVTVVKDEVFQCITSLHTKEHPDSESAYPHLRTLLQFDTREFLNVLALAFEEPEFNDEEGIMRRQRVVDILLQVMVESIGFSPTQVGVLFTFLARQMARHENTIIVNRVLFEQVLEFLSNPEDETRHEERQQALMELIHAGGLAQFDETRLLRLAENAKFFRVCEFLYEKRREYHNILLCYIKDPSRRYHAFSFMDSILQSAGYSAEEKASLREEALRQLDELVSIDCRQAAVTVATSLQGSLSAVIAKLKDKEKVLFEFLQGVMAHRDANGSAINPDKQGSLDPDVVELYVDLMCRFRPQDVCNFIKINEGYRLEETLQICRRHKASEATAYLLEKAGDIQGAFGILLQHLQTNLKQVIQVLQEADSKPADVEVLFSKVELELYVVVQLCQRSSGKMDKNSREALWFPLLEAIMAPQRKLKDVSEKSHLDHFKDMTHHVLNSMMGYIAPPDMLQKIMRDPAYNTGKFGEIKELIIGMLENYNYEQTLMVTCKNLLYHDLYVHLRTLTRAANRGFVPRGDHCNLCNADYTTPSNPVAADGVIVFRCGHCYHEPCLRAVGSIHVLDAEETFVCYLCSNAKRSGGQLTSSRFHRSLSNTGHQLRDTAARDRQQASQMSLDPHHVAAFENMRKAMKTPSRMAILTELAKPETASGYRKPLSVFQNESFRLRLAPPPPMELG